MEKIASGPHYVNKHNRKSNYAITTAKKSINTNRQRVGTAGTRVDLHEITYFGGAILARGDSERLNTMNGRDAKISQPNKELRLHVEHNDLIITKDPIAVSSPKQIETIVAPRKFSNLEPEPTKNQSLIRNIADRRKLMEKYTIKYKNPIETNIMNANNTAKNPALANVTLLKMPIESLKDDHRIKNAVQTNVVLVNEGQTKSPVEVAKIKSRSSSKKMNVLDGNVKTMIQKIKVEESELDSYYTVDTENADTDVSKLNTVKHSTPPATDTKLVSNGGVSTYRNGYKKMDGAVGNSSKDVKPKSAKNEKLLITLRPTFPNNFTTSSESEILPSDDPDYRKQRSFTRRITQYADQKKTAEPRNHNDPKPVTPKTVKDVKQIHQNLLKRNTLLLQQLQKAKLIDEQESEKQEKVKKKKQKKAKRIVRPYSPLLESGAMSPKTTEVASWVPRSIDDHTKPYYEAWVNTTLAAITKHNRLGEKNDLYVKKKNIIQTFQKALEDYDKNDIDTFEDYSDEKFTGRIKFKVKR